MEALAIDWSEALEKARDLGRDVLPFMPMYMHLIASALLPIVCGSFASLSRPSSAAKPTKKSSTKTALDDEDDEDEEIQKMEGLTPSDAIVFPLTAGAVLAGLYYLIQRYGAVVINLILGWYFALVGVYSVSLFINDALAIAWDFILPDFYSDQGKLWRVRTTERRVEKLDDPKVIRLSPLPGMLGRLLLPKILQDFLWRQREALKTKYLVKCNAKKIIDFEATLTRHNVFSAILGAVVVVAANTVIQAWYLTNLQGFAVSYGALQLMSPTSFSTGSLILSALFFYDIWAVFATPLMVTVAENLDVPIKLVFPRPDDALSFSMLGLGDIVIPGIMIAMALRFDLYMFYLKKQKPATESKDAAHDEKVDQQSLGKAPYVPVTGHWGTRLHTRGVSPEAIPQRYKSTFPKTYFTASLFGYVIGMINTLVAMNISNHPQPALLYLVPCVLTSLWATSFARGEFKMMTEFSEGIDLELDDALKQSESKAASETKSESGQSQDWWSWLTGKTPQTKSGEASSKTTAAQDNSNSSKFEENSTTGLSDQKTDSGSEATKKSAKDDTLFSFTVSLARL
jgi:minor histocompatibility antigen H13